jgi:K+-dependent Na+/Ca+ exchanger-like protein
MMIVFWLGILLVIFYALAKIVDEHFVESLEILVSKLNIAPEIAGATFMAVGSSAPELFTSIAALTRIGAGNVGAGTIVGSAIFNILVIIGASAIVSTVVLDWRPVLRDLFFYVFSIAILIFTFWDGVIHLWEASLFIILYLFYLIFLYFWSKKFGDKFNKKSDITEKIQPKKTFFWDKKFKFYLNKIFPNLKESPDKWPLAFLISIALIAILSFGLVESAISLAHLLNISETIIALTILAAGTSVPDLLASINVTRRGSGDMAVANAVGSNTFDILMGLGLPWFIYVLITKNPVIVSTESLSSSIFLLFGTVVALFAILVARKFKIGKKVGFFLIGVYVMYLTYAIFSAVS